MGDTHMEESGYQVGAGGGWVFCGLPQLTAEPHAVGELVRHDDGRRGEVVRSNRALTTVEWPGGKRQQLASRLLDVDWRCGCGEAARHFVDDLHMHMCEDCYDDHLRAATRTSQEIEKREGWS